MKGKVCRVLLLLMVMLVLGGCGAQKLAGASKLPPTDLSHTTMTEVHADGSSTQLRLQAAPNTLLVLYFGYTTCPDICPTTLADLQNARHMLGKKADKVALAFATVDRTHDTAPVLAAYLDRFGFGTAGHALRPADDAELAGVERTLYASSQVTKNNDGTPAVGHTAWTYLVDDHGRLVDEWPYGTTSKEMANDLRILLSRG